MDAQILNSNLRVKTFSTEIDTIYIDTINMVPGSVSIKFLDSVSPLYYLDYNNAMIVFLDKNKAKTFEITYRVFNFDTKKTYVNKSRKIIEPAFNPNPRYLYNFNESNESNKSLFSNGLNVSGNISRGVSAGNNQDLVVNSNLNLQMNGSLGKGFKILAAISDENNPIQPQGNTQQIQDFDKVFISIYKDSNYLTVGDFLMENAPQSYFMKYYKKSRGAQLQIKKNLEFGTINSFLNAAVSRGKFSRNEIQGAEGNQGPYRLLGANSEQNIIVISGTESVFLDGQKLGRGQQNDYVIDYNVGELVFMPKRLINQYSRIVVEFQYSDRNYARTVLSSGISIENKQWRHSFQYFTEQDNRFQPTDTFNQNKIQSIIENAGDNLPLFVSQRVFKEYQSDRVNYRKIDSLGYEIYVFTNIANSDTIFYALNFSLIGAQKGNYVLSTSSANGRIFNWVAPIGGVPQGSYEPVKELIAPKRNQMLTYSSVFQPSKNSFTQVEVAYSNNNLNSLSNIDKKNDDGIGLFFKNKNKDIKIGELKLSNDITLEYVNSNFKYVERYRAVEFNRIWNRQLSNQSTGMASANEFIGDLNTQIQYLDKHFLNLNISSFNRFGTFDGKKIKTGYTFQSKALIFKVSGENQQSTANVNTINRKNSTQMLNSNLQFQNKKLQTAIGFNYESSEFKDDTANRFLANSFRYYESVFYIKSISNSKWKYQLDASLRNDFLAHGNQFLAQSTGFNYAINTEYSTKRNNRLNIVHTYRYLNQINNTEQPQTILGRIEYVANFFKKSLVSATFYQVGTGREQRRQFSYLPVLNGTGTHSWNDYNQNGLEEIDEFEVAAFKDKANYIKILLPTNEFIKSNINEFNQSFRLQAPSAWQGGKKYQRILSKFNSITSIKTDRRLTDNQFLTIINPFLLKVADTSLIAISSLIKQTTFFNRSNAKFGLEHNIQASNGKQFLNNGFEWRKQTKNGAVARYAFNQNTGLILSSELSQKSNESAFFESRSFNYRQSVFNPELYYQNIKGMRLGAIYKYSESINDPKLSVDKGFIHEIGANARYFIVNRGNLDMKISRVAVRYIGNPSSPLAFDILNGLNNGTNLIWNTNLGVKSKNNIQFNINYEGRKSAQAKAVHIGRIEARYVF